VHTLAVHVHLLVNPHASRVTPQRGQAVLEALGREHRVELVPTQRRGHASELARAAVADGADAVAVLGGDGTLNEAADALVGTDTVLVALPGGGTNVFCRTIGLPDDAVEAARLQSAALVHARLRRIGVGTVEDGTHDPRAFLVHTGIGWDAALVAVVERHQRWKRRLNHALFAAAGVRTFFGGYDRRRAHFSVELGDGTTVPRAWFALALNSDPYTYVGHRPFVVDPANDALRPLTVVVLSSMRVRHFVPVMVDALRGTGLSSRPWLTVARDVDEVVLRRDTTMPHQVDGDHLGEAEVLRLRWRPDALSVAVGGPGADQPR
jgi:diacylglycerol kinase family enzyme